MPHDPLPSLEQLEAKIQAARDVSSSKSATAPKPLNYAMRVGTDLVAGVGVGAAVGYFLDQWWHTSPLMLILCFFLGTAAGIKLVMETAKRVSADAEAEEKSRTQARKPE